jgi:hypothetical protein
MNKANHFTVCLTLIFFFNSHSGGGVESKLGPLGMSAIYRPIVPAPGDCEDGESGGKKTGKGKSKYSEKTCPSATLSTTNPT